ncbi:hypothetical protein BKA67DRAFT_684456 [Truncatella angustata]|uniref:Heterokaryon incompatibility domain-containing protein n=1 Tax=Truncatella angustata TaxID=152316 RepID=A0A9P8RJ54_9PEZI|nr:uncharacterized protein BKA67DRAFT_684456 [Truncatella angustata]KAH6646983.1 hypothetical protein BKA67DRAFT_684456 [Truncatella angustata]
MRLIRSTLQGKPCLTSFSESTIPPYAVLSHTWETQDQEVTLKDMLESSGRTKAGYRKVEFCGDQTQKDNLEYFWVDSCCIDRSSSAELSRSINSMFRWYQNAQKCYVYLQDVSTLKGDDRESWEPSFRNSRWFTRGWTLQELLAPKTVEFYSKEGQKLGDRKTLEGPVHEATGIARKALQGTPLTQFDVEERFSWVYKRQTSEPEDKAYSMLGIFDVSLPLVYGEGEIHALRRLREAIARENSITVNIGLPG